MVFPICSRIFLCFFSILWLGDLTLWLHVAPQCTAMHPLHLLHRRQRCFQRLPQELGDLACRDDHGTLFSQWIMVMDTKTHWLVVSTYLPLWLIYMVNIYIWLIYGYSKFLAPNHDHLVGGIPTPLKNMSLSVGRILPNWMEKWSKCSKPPTRIGYPYIYIFMVCNVYI